MLAVLRQRRAYEGLVFVPTIQHALNCTRKAEARVKKVQDDKVEHAQMWKLWEADMKAAWLREKKRFAAEAERLERETMESVQAQTDARCNLREAFEACYNTAAAGPGAMEVEDAANSAEWEATVAGWNQEAQPDWNSVLQRAYGDVSPPADTEADAGIRRPNAGTRCGAPPGDATGPLRRLVCPPTHERYLRPLPGSHDRYTFGPGGSLWIHSSWTDPSDFDCYERRSHRQDRAVTFYDDGARAVIWP